MTTILASLTGYGNDKSTLTTAFDVAQRVGSHVECLFVRPDFPDVETLAASNVFLRRQLLIDQLEVFEKESDERAKNAKQAFDEVCNARAVKISEVPGTKGLTASWLNILGTDIPTTTHEGRLNDLVVLGREAVHGVVEIDRAGAITLGCGRPVLLTSAAPRAEMGKHIAIAWKDKPEAARAVTAAAPFLRKAEKVTVATAAEASDDQTAEQEGNRLAEQLRWNGCSVERRHAAHTPHPASMTLLSEVYASGADLLVMGAYGHNRFREIVFGGVTRDVITECALPVLMFH